MADSHETPNMYPDLSAPLNVPPSATFLNDEQHFRLNKINEMKDYLASFDYFDKSLIVLSVTTGIVFIASFATVIGAHVGITSASFSITFSMCTGIVKKLLKTTRNKMKKHNKTVMLARSKLNSIESKISEELIKSEISHEDFMTIIDEEKKYRELKESVRIMNSQRSDTEKINLIKEGKKIVINENIKRNEIIHNCLKV